VLVDGFRHWAEGGRLRLRGLSKGAHDVLVAPTGVGGLFGLEWTVVLEEGEVRERVVVLE